MSTPQDQEYEKNARSILNVLKNNGLYVSKAAVAGSRGKGTSTQSSDLDIIFAVSGDPSKNSVYPKVKSALATNFPKYNARLGTDGNVVKLDFPGLGHTDLKLLSSSEFDRQLANVKSYRRFNI